jgi:hypothetical protein
VPATSGCGRGRRDHRMICQPLTWGYDRPRSSPCPSSRWETDR